MTESHFLLWSASQRKAEQLSKESPRSWAQLVRPGARAGDSAHHEGASRGRCEHRVDLHRGRGWVDYASGAAGFGRGPDRLENWLGDRPAPSPFSVIPAGPIQPSSVSGPLVQPWGGFRFSSARSSKVPSSARSSKVPSSARSSKMPTLPPDPASSTAVFWHPLHSPSAPYLYGASPAGLPSSSVTGDGVSLSSTSSGCASSLRPTGSVGLLPPVSSTWVLSHSGSAVDLRISASVTRALSSTLAPWILGIHLARWLSASGSSTTCSTDIGRPPGVAIPPPCLLPLSAPPWAIIMAVAWVLLCSSCSGSLLSDPWLLPPLSPLGLCLPPPSRVSVLLLSCLSSSHPPLPMLFPRCEDAPSGRGRYVRIMDLPGWVFAHCDPVSPSCWLLIWFQVCPVIILLIVCVFKVLSIQLVFVGS